MNPHENKPVSLAALVRSLWANRQLILQMARRDVIGRYKGSVMGVMWSFFNPLLLLTIYTFVFSVVFKARWGGALPASKTEFALLLFVGMIIHTLFAETLTQAPMLIVNNVSYVKKIIFPLEILPVAALGTALFHACVSLAVWLAFFVLFNGFIHWTVIFMPLVLLPLIMLTVGIAWALASLGVFLRDVAQPIGLIMTVLLFASPVFYPITALPVAIRPWLMLNPLTLIIEQARAVLLFGQLPDWSALAIYGATALVIAWLGYAWFQKTRKGFADVI
ncbi:MULTISPECIES: ABC transporter permease [unclassified Paraburkholderia]|uniref:ABC transporter permease n=1 Tax=unclassified Paraburkholderia TaxID=2615204 RepID=UPI00161F80D9|nr:MULTISPECIES: ABC transporter permease [unclassified Paraburkholderia]MBB5445174.1 lipopolysaccharide transport system permease protein [Paraburkholderia sp. WSM4177]MBB5485722.1 lipopolysaccharide transport system permease protein [Paraburkholderia sp. WSM4180]